MNKTLIKLFIFLLPMTLQAAYTFKNGKLYKSEEVATMSVQEHYSAAMQAQQEKNWEELISQMVIVIKNFPDSPFSQDAYYYLALGYFHLKEYEYANRYFGTYLKKQATPKYFEEAIRFKYEIAEQYQLGAKKHVLGFEALPKWIPAQLEALSIYDEVITALPHHELAAKALFGKAKILLEDEEYKSSIETYQTLIRRFSKHPLAAESFIGIGNVYLSQAKEQYPDQDFLDLMEINLSKFKTAFPGHERVAVAEGMLEEMREVYASDLYDTARFYERTKKPGAAHIYYTRILSKYPRTGVAKRAQTRLEKLKHVPQKNEEVGSQEATETLPSSQEEILPTQGPSLLNLPVQSGQIVQGEETLQEDKR